MGWKVVPAVDVEHMPLMIHTLCAVGRWRLLSPLPLPLSRMGLLCFFFLSELHTWKPQGSWNLLFMYRCSCVMVLLILPRSWTQLKKWSLLFSQTCFFILPPCYSSFFVVVFGVIMLHPGAFPFHLLINQFDLSDLHQPPNLESYGWVNYFKLSWCCAAEHIYCKAFE